MTDTLTDVLVAGYQGIDSATADFEGLLARVAAKEAVIEAAILVAHDLDGNVTVQRTADHLGRKGAKWGGGVGFLVGPGGSAAPRGDRGRRGRGCGSSAGSPPTGWSRASTTSSGEAMKPGTAAIIAMFDTDQRLAVEQALPGSPAKSVVTTDKKGHRRPQGLARRGDGQVRPGPLRPAHPRPHLRRRGWPHAQGLGRRLADDPRAEGARRRPQRPARHHRRRRLRRHRHVRGPGQHAGLHARPADGPDLQPLPRHGGLLADTGRAAHRPQPAPGRLRFDRGVPRARSPATRAPSRRAVPACPASSRRTATSRAASASGT